MRYKLRDQLFLIMVAALALLAVLNYDQLMSGLKLVFSSMTTVLMGGVIAFVLNVPMKKLENLFAKVPVFDKAKRPLAIASVLVIFALILTGTVMIIMPTLTSTLSQLAQVITTGIPKLITILEEQGLLSDQVSQQLTSYISGYTGWGTLSTYVTNFLSSLVSNVGGIFSNIMSTILSLFITLSILSSKEHLQAMTLKLLYAAFPASFVKKISYVGEVIIETYDRFLMSQIIEAVIIGVLIWGGYTLLGIPYGAMSGILAGVLSFIPYFGPFTACFISALFVFVQNPWQALFAVILFQVLQLIEGNVIYPRVVGQSVGLPTLFTLIAVIIGGNLFGLLGMIFFTPIFAVIYRLVKEWTYSRLVKKEIVDSPELPSS